MKLLEEQWPEDENIPEARYLLGNEYLEAGDARAAEAELRRALKLGAGAAILAGAFAVPLAWGVSRTNMPARGFVRMLVLATFITPPYTGAVAWILLAGPNAGWLNRIYMMITRRALAWRD